MEGRDTRCVENATCGIPDESMDIHMDFSLFVLVKLSVARMIR